MKSIRTPAENTPGPPAAGGGQTRAKEGLTRELSVPRGPGRGGAERARAVPLRRAARGPAERLCDWRGGITGSPSPARGSRLEPAAL
jgi:hypothetical protein